MDRDDETSPFTKPPFRTARRWGPFAGLALVILLVATVVALGTLARVTFDGLKGVGDDPGEDLVQCECLQLRSVIETTDWGLASEVTAGRAVVLQRRPGYSLTIYLLTDDPPAEYDALVKKMSRFGLVTESKYPNKKTFVGGQLSDWSAEVVNDTLREIVTLHVILTASTEAQAAETLTGLFAAIAPS